MMIGVPKGVYYTRVVGVGEDRVRSVSIKIKKISSHDFVQFGIL